MKIIITEQQRKSLSERIYEYIDDFYKNIEKYKYDFILEDKSLINYPEDDSKLIAIDIMDEYTVFRVYLPKYWAGDSERVIELRKNSPILQVEDSVHFETMFGNMWKDEMKKWFNNKFKDEIPFEIKTVTS